VFFTKVLKGIAGLSDEQARDMVVQRGLVSNWWRDVGTITPQGGAHRLTEENLYRHLSEYDKADPVSGRPFGETTPYISATAGVVERDAFLRRNLLQPALLTALSFAAGPGGETGHVFYFYVLTLGRKTVAFEEFAEEVRELNIYTRYLDFHDEGEVAAKVHVPCRCIERVARFPATAAQIFRHGVHPAPEWSFANPGYVPPEEYTNVREVLG
jgi:hypothetical protein